MKEPIISFTTKPYRVENLIISFVFSLYMMLIYYNIKRYRDITTFKKEKKKKNGFHNQP
jgi:hypothetical protein